MAFPDSWSWAGPATTSYQPASVTPEQIAANGYLPWAQDSLIAQAGFDRENDPVGRQLWQLEQQYRNSPEIYNNPNASFFDYLAANAPDLAALVPRNANTEAYDQRIRYLANQGLQRRDNLEAEQARDRAGGPAAQAALLIGALGGTAGALGGAAGGAAAGGSSYGGAATTYPLAGGGAITGSALPGVAVPAAVSGAAGSGLVAGAVPAAAGAAASTMPNWVGNYLMPGLNAGLGIYGANQASDAMSDASDRAIAEGQRQFDLTRSDQMPWITGGTESINRLRDPAANFAASPGYEWRRSEGQRGIENNFASRGLGQSGNALRALTEYNQNMASDEYNNWFGQQLNLAGMGSDTARSVGAFGANTASNAGSYLTNQGVARASGVLGRTNALQTGLYDGYDNYLYGRRR